MKYLRNSGNSSTKSISILKASMMSLVDDHRLNTISPGENYDDGDYFVAPLSPQDYHVIRSQSIPISKYIHKTPSELQLCEDEAIADYRDYCMYSRIVGAINKQQTRLADQQDLQYQNDETLTNLMKTRQGLKISSQQQQMSAASSAAKEKKERDVVRILQKATAVCMVDDADEDWQPGLSYPEEDGDDVFTLDM